MCSFTATTELQNFPCLCVVQQMIRAGWAGSSLGGMWDVQDWEGNHPKGTRQDPPQLCTLSCCSAVKIGIFNHWLQVKSVATENQFLGKQEATHTHPKMKNMSQTTIKNNFPQISRKFPIPPSRAQLPESPQNTITSFPYKLLHCLAQLWA